MYLCTHKCLYTQMCLLLTNTYVHSLSHAQINKLSHFHTHIQLHHPVCTYRGRLWLVSWKGPISPVLPAYWLTEAIASVQGVCVHEVYVCAVFVCVYIFESPVWNRGKKRECFFFIRFGGCRVKLFSGEHSLYCSSLYRKWQAWNPLLKGSLVPPSTVTAPWNV